MIEAARHVAGQFDMRQLVGPDRHQSGAVQQNVRRLQQRIAKKAVGVEVLVLQVLLQFLVRWHPLQPAQRTDHRQQEVQLGVLGHLRLDEQRGRARADPGGQPVHRHAHDVLRDFAGTLVVSGQRMPVDDAEEAFVLMLQPDPVLQYAVVVAKVQSAAGAHTGNHTPL